MKALNTYITEKLVLNKNTFKGPKYKYFPKDKYELADLVKKLIKERGDHTDLNDIDVSAIKDFYINRDGNGIFADSGAENIDISKWDVSNAEDLSGLFAFCKTLKSVDLSSWDISSCLYLKEMFACCDNLKATGDLSRWNTGNVTVMDSMFQSCNVLTDIGDISGWDINSCENFDFMFFACYSLKNIGDLNKWNVFSDNVSKTKTFELTRYIKKPDWYED